MLPSHVLADSIHRLRYQELVAPAGWGRHADLVAWRQEAPARVWAAVAATVAAVHRCIRAALGSAAVETRGPSVRPPAPA